MEFRPIEYMEWAKGRSSAAVNLSRSGADALSLRDLPLSLADMDINGEDAYGYPPLVRAIAARSGAGEENVVPTLGTSQAIFFACAALLERGDRVVIEKPAYEPFLSCARAVGAEIHRFERKFKDGYGIDPDSFRGALPDKTKLVILSNLHNPSGSFLAAGTIRELAAAAADKGAWLFVDEVYLEHMPGGAGRSAFGLAENILIGSSLTKVYGLAGLRCGWLLAPPSLVERMRRIMDHLFVQHVYIGEMLAARLFPLLDSVREGNRPLFEENRRTVRGFIEQSAALEWVEPAAGIIGFPRVKKGPSGDALAGLLRERYETSIVPGRFFEDPRHFRLGFGVAPEVLARGLANIERVLAHWDG